MASVSSSHCLPSGRRTARPPISPDTSAPRAARTNAWAGSVRCQCNYSAACGPSYVRRQQVAGSSKATRVASCAPSTHSQQRRCVASQALPSFAFIPAVCFDAACQAKADQAFLWAISIPVLVLIAAIAYALRPVPKQLVEQGRVFEDPSTGAVFAAPEGEDVKPERDANGELAFKAISYTPWPVDDGAEGDRIRVPVGKVNDRQPRTFVFDRVLKVPSELVVVTLPRPLGIVFEYDTRFKRTLVADIVEGTGADQKRKMASVNPQLKTAAALPGDILRAVTATNFVYPTQALFGAVAPERHIVLYGADRQSWTSVSGALRKGESRDGEVTLVLERRREPV